MKQAVTLFSQAISHIFRNAGDALRIVAWPFLLCLVIEFWYTASTLSSTYYEPSAASNVATTLSGFLMVCVIAVGWHRLILLGERPGPFGTIWRGGVFWTYFLRWFFVGLFIGLGVLVLGVGLWFVINTFSAGSAEIIDGAMSGFVEGSFPSLLGGAAGWIAIWLFLWLLFRLGQVLPHVAIERSWMFVGEAWQMTKPCAWPIFWLAGMASLLQSITFVLPLWLFDQYLWSENGTSDAAEYAYGVIVLVLYTVTVLVGASLLTTIYQAVAPDQELPVQSRPEVRIS